MSPQLLSLNPCNENRTINCTITCNLAVVMENGAYLKSKFKLTFKWLKFNGDIDSCSCFCFGLSLFCFCFLPLVAVAQFVEQLSTNLPVMSSIPGSSRQCVNMSLEKTLEHHSSTASCQTMISPKQSIKYVFIIIAIV